MCLDAIEVHTRRNDSTTTIARIPDCFVDTRLFSVNGERAHLPPGHVEDPNAGRPAHCCDVANSGRALSRVRVGSRRTFVVDEGEVFTAWTWQRQTADFEVRVVFQTTASRDSVPELLKPDGLVLVRPERNPSATLPLALRYQLASPGQVEAFIWDVQGRLLRKWLVGEIPAGEHRLEWGGTATGGRRAANGVYFWDVRVAGAEGEARARTSVVLVR